MEFTHADYERAARVEGYPAIEDANHASTLLRSAERLVEAYVAASTCPTLDDETRLNAVACQVAFWHTNQIAPLSGGVQDSKVLASASLNGGSVSFAGAEKTTAARETASQSLCFEARLILGLAGCNPAPVKVVG